MDKQMRDLIEIINFTEKVAAKMYGMLDEAEIYRVIKEEFDNSKRYTASILLLTDDASKLRIVETSMPSERLKAGEKVSKLQLKAYEIDLNKSTLYGQVMREGKTVQTYVSDIIGELFPRPLAYLISKATGYEKKPCVLTPLYRRGKIIGAFAIFLPELAEHFTSSVKNFAQHISTALELAEEQAKRKSMEEELWKSRNQLSSILSSLVDLVFVFDEKGRFIFYHSPSSTQLYLPPEKFMGKKHSEVMPPHINELFSKAFERNRRGEVDECEYALELGDRTKWFHAKISPVTLNGKFTSSVAIVREITRRKQLEEMLRESEEKYRVLVENSPNLVAIQQEGVLKYVNRAMCERLGWTFEEMTSPAFNVIEKIVPQRFQILAKENIAKRLRGEHVPSYEYNLKTCNGLEFPVIVRSQTILYQGKPAIEVILVDITERKKAEEALTRYSEDLEKIVEERTRKLKEAERMAAIGETAAMVGHDLRNPLQTIINTVYLAKKRLKSMPSQERLGLEKLLETVEEQVEYANKIVSDIHDYTRPLRPEFVDTNLHQLIEDTLKAIRLPKNVKVSMEVEKGFKLMVDPQLMRRVFTNLLTNAVQAMPDGGRLTIRASKTEEAASISVEDTGVGIAEENLPKLFQPLFTIRAKGMGFGLSICKRIIEVHGGTILVESEVGKGSTFTVKIPLIKEVS